MFGGGFYFGEGVAEEFLVVVGSGGIDEVFGFLFVLGVVELRGGAGAAPGEQYGSAGYFGSGEGLAYYGDVAARHFVEPGSIVRPGEAGVGQDGYRHGGPPVGPNADVAGVAFGAP